MVRTSVPRSSRWTAKACRLFRMRNSRHSCALHLLQSGVDIAVIALWLGHENIQTTHCYIEADLAMKEKALQKVAPAGQSLKRFKAKDALLKFLESL